MIVEPKNKQNVSSYKENKSRNPEKDSQLSCNKKQSDVKRVMGRQSSIIGNILTTGSYKQQRRKNHSKSTMSGYEKQEIILSP